MVSAPSDADSTYGKRLRRLTWKAREVLQGLPRAISPAAFSSHQQTLPRPSITRPSTAKTRSSHLRALAPAPIAQSSTAAPVFLPPNPSSLATDSHVSPAFVNHSHAPVSTSPTSDVGISHNVSEAQPNRKRRRSQLQSIQAHRQHQVTIPAVKVRKVMKKLKHTLDNRIQSTMSLARRPLQSETERHELGRMDVSCPFCGAMHYMEEKTFRSAKSHPLFSSCCQRGQVDLPLLSTPPPFLRSVLEGTDSQSLDFRQNIRQYNMSLAFTSLGVTEDRLVNRRGGWVFRISGELCHLVGSLRADEGQPPAYAQLYVYNSRLALNQRMNRNTNLREDTMQSLQSMLLTHHRYSHEFMHAYEILREYPDAPDAEVRLRVMPGQSLVYAAPTSDEVALILPGDGTAPERRDIILRSRSSDGGRLARIDDGHAAYAPLHYVLMFPYGTNGWHRDIFHRVPPGENRPANFKPARVSQTEYSAFRLHTRRSEYPSIHRGGRLFQQYVVDMWASADQTRLSYLRFNQGKLRATLYNGLEDWLRAENIGDPKELGMRTILPSSYIGGPRNMQQRYQDAMAIARFFRNIDLFITITTNPEWLEIQRELLPGQTAYDRPDLVARVFKLKLDELLDDIFKRKIFGNVFAYIYVIEFQKRGLPHAHILIILDNDSRIRTPLDVDSCISAQWPDPENNAQLFDTVKSCMIHGPCGNINPNAPCMKDGMCSKGYPKPYQETTSNSDDGYPLYARPNDGRTYPVKVRNTTVDVDNRWIVPYNSYLSCKYNCHINVESVATFRTLKYCFKYIHKGPDRATIEYQLDEIKTYIDGRYIAAPEAVWRIFHFPTHEQFPAVVRLQVHLPGQHMVIFDPNEPLETIVARASSEVTTLTEFFKINNSVGPEADLARMLTYQEFPHKFVWEKTKKAWSIRQRGFALGRIYFVPPTAGERFYLRTLLTVVRGPKSFKDLMTYQDVTYPTFQDACKARGLLEDDGEWRLCLQEASEMQSGARLRHLFTSMLLFCQLSSPEQLWEDFRQHICDDLRVRIPNPTPERIYDYGLFLIERLLSDSGYTLQNFPHMPIPREHWSALTNNPFISEQLNYNADDERELFLHHMENIQRVPEQLQAYNEIMTCITSGNGGLFFLNGAGGTGKTYVYQTLCHKLRSEGKIVLCVASSGIAALLLPGGRTAHSTFRIPINTLDSESTCNISKQDQRADLLRAVNLIIWDEALMHTRFAHEALDKTLRDICNDDDHPFGGKTVIFGGDFQQTLPVVPRGSQEDIISVSLPRSYLWQNLRVLTLKVNMRLLRQTTSFTEEQAFAEWLLSVGHGEGIDNDGTIPFDPRLRVDSADALITSIFPHIEQAIPPPQYFHDRIILAPKNIDVTHLNETILDKMPGCKLTLYSADSIEPEPSSNEEPEPLPLEFLRTLEAPGLPPGELHLKPGCPLILLRNLAPARGLCNGTRMILKRATHRVLEVEILGGKHSGELAFIPRITLIPSTQTNFSFRLRRRQFPVQLAFAMTINKAQGQSVYHVGLDLRNQVFAHGQLYVALSRATSSRRIKILLPSDTTDCRMKNVVYPEIFQIS